MKSGMLRKIDELGRIVIPKEIRKNINIHDGEELEILVENNSILLKKSNNILNNKSLLKKLLLLFSDYLKVSLMITDNEKIIVSMEDCYIDMEINDELRLLMNNRESKKGIGNIFNLSNIYYIVNPIIIDGSCNSLLILLCDHELNDDIINSFNLLLNLIIAIYDIT